MYNEWRNSDMLMVFDKFYKEHMLLSG